MNRRTAVSLLIGGVASLAFRSPEEWVTVADSLPNTHGRTYPGEVLQQMASIVNTGTVHLLKSVDLEYESEGELSRLVGIVHAARMQDGLLRVKARPLASRDLRGKYIVTCCMGTAENGIVKLADDPRLYFALCDGSSFTGAKPISSAS